MKLNGSVSFDCRVNTFEELKQMIAMVPEDATDVKCEIETEWVGYGSNEREEPTYFTITWSLER